MISLFQKYIMKKNIPVCILALISIQHLFSQELMHVKNGAVVNIQNGAQLSIAGGITLENGSTLINNGIITLLKNSSGGSSDWNDISTTGYNYGTGMLVLNSNSGSNSHILNSKNLFEHITVNAGAVSFGSDIQANNWTLVTGPVNTGGFKAIIVNPSTLALQADVSNAGFVNSWFNGNLRRIVSPATVNTYTFPLGNASHSNVAVLDNLQANPLSGVNYLDASFGPKPGTDAGLIVTEGGIPYTSVNSGGVWFVTPDAEPSSGKYDLLLYFNGFTGLTDNQFAALRRPDASSNAAEWVVPSGSVLPPTGTAGRTVLSGYARRNGISEFSQFGIGSSLSALPVTLVDFEARRTSSAKVQLDWETAGEQNNKGFGIERRLDNQTSFGAVNFIASIAAGGNSGINLRYTFTDNNSYAGISYYRLKQVDLDDRFTYTVIRAVSGISGASVSVKMYPNPNRGQFVVRIDGTTKTFKAFVTDASGKTVKMFTVNGNTDVPVYGLSSGSYIMVIENVFENNKSFAEKILIVK
jgi:Secretion system C-terminal sorting domain